MLGNTFQAQNGKRGHNHIFVEGRARSLCGIARIVNAYSGFRVVHEHPNIVPTYVKSCKKCFNIFVYRNMR